MTTPEAILAHDDDPVVHEVKQCPTDTASALVRVKSRYILVAAASTLRAAAESPVMRNSVASGAVRSAVAAIEEWNRQTAHGADAVKEREAIIAALHRIQDACETSLRVGRDLVDHGLAKRLDGMAKTCGTALDCFKAARQEGLDWNTDLSQSKAFRTLRPVVEVDLARALEMASAVAWTVRAAVIDRKGMADYGREMRAMAAALKHADAAPEAAYQQVRYALIVCANVLDRINDDLGHKPRADDWVGPLRSNIHAAQEWIGDRASIAALRPASEEDIARENLENVKPVIEIQKQRGLYVTGTRSARADDGLVGNHARYAVVEFSNGDSLFVSRTGAFLRSADGKILLSQDSEWRVRPMLDLPQAPATEHAYGGERAFAA